MDLSPELTVAIVSVCGIIIAAIIKFVPKKIIKENNKKEIEKVNNRIDRRQSIIMCNERHKNLAESIKRIEKTAVNTNDVVIEILKKI